MEHHDSFRGVGPKGYRRSDESILEEVCERLTRHGRIDASDIEVKVEGGEITLSGTVPNRMMKRAAEGILEDVPGVNDIHNRLHVRVEGAQEPRGQGGATGKSEQNETRGGA